MKFVRVLAPLVAGAVAVAAPAPVMANDLGAAMCMQDQDRDCIDRRTRAEREADAAEIRRLNNEQARHVRERDARYADGWRAHDAYPQQRADYERRQADYERSRAQYEADMAEWRRRVRLCRQGYYEYCD